MPPPRAIFYATSFESSFGVDTSDFSYGNPQIIEIVLNHHSVVELKPKQYHLIKEKSGCVEKTKYEIGEESFAKNIVDICPNPCSPLLLPNETFPICNDGIHTEYDAKCALAVLYDLEEAANVAPLCSRTDYEGYFIEDNKPIKGLHSFQIISPYYWHNYDFHDSEVRQADSYAGEFNYNPIVKMSYRFLNLNSLQPYIP